MYAKVKAHPGVQHLYAQKLIREQVITDDELKGMIDRVIAKYEDILKRAKQIVSEKPHKAELRNPVEEEDGSVIFESGIPAETVREISDKISLVPAEFHINPKMVNQLARRAKMGSGEVPMDWAFGEAIAMGSLVKEGFPVRLSGQDSGRGTFSQRHASMYDMQTGEPWRPLQDLEAKLTRRQNSTFLIVRFRNPACWVLNMVIRFWPRNRW